MSFLTRTFERYTGFLRSLKGVYVLNNWINRDKLTHNRNLYTAHGVEKSIFAPIGSKDFPKATEKEIPWLDRPNALENLEKNKRFQGFSPEMQANIRQFIQDGFMVINGHYSDMDCDAMNAEVDGLLKTGKAGFNYTGRKIFNFHEKSKLAEERFLKNADIVELFTFLMGKPVIPFQSLNFVWGSEQRAHSDSIHMTTEPKGYLIASWTALEDTNLENGPLFYYPGSHRLPYVMTEDYDSGNSFLLIGQESNRRYEDHMEKLIAKHGLKKQYFLAKKGDVLVWHANLLHGGSPITRQGATRKSMVCHYFCSDVICYHEMSQRPALLPKE